VIPNSKIDDRLEGKTYNILHILTQLNVGGAELLVLNLLRRLDRSLFSPFVCTFTPDGDLVADFETDRVPVLGGGVLYESTQFSSWM